MTERFPTDTFTLLDARRCAGPTKLWRLTVCFRLVVTAIAVAMNLHGLSGTTFVGAVRRKGIMNELHLFAGIGGGILGGVLHRRDRIWILAHTLFSGRSSKSGQQQNQWPSIADSSSKGNVADANRVRKQQSEGTIEEIRGWISHCREEISYSKSTRLEIRGEKCGNEKEVPKSINRSSNGWGNPWRSESGMGRVASRVAHRVDRLKAIGNGQVSLVAATAWNLLT